MHKRMIERAAAVVLFACVAASAFGGGQMSIDQIDSSRLATRHEVDVYLRISGPSGQAVPDLAARDFTLFEGRSVAGATGSHLPEVRRFSLFRGPRPHEGVTYLILVDESQPARIDAIRSALRSFVNSIEDPADRIGLVSFGTQLHIGVLPTRKRRETDRAVETLHGQAGHGATMPLAAALASSAADLAGWSGRKVIILITGNPALSAAHLAGRLLDDQISLSVIDLAGGAASSAPPAIAQATGGEVLGAETPKQLENTLLAMNAAVRDEYRLTFAPRMTPGARREVKVEYRGSGGTVTATARYSAGTTYAAPPGGWNPLFLVPLLASIAALIAVSRLPLSARRKGPRKSPWKGPPTGPHKGPQKGPREGPQKGRPKGPQKGPRLEVVGRFGSRFLSFEADRIDLSFDSRHPTAVPLAGEHSDDDTIRVAKGKHGGATAGIRFTYDRGAGSCTVESDEPISVNNRKTRRRSLRSGDVLRIGDATIVFDDP